MWRAKLGQAKFLQSGPVFHVWGGLGSRLSHTDVNSGGASNRNLDLNRQVVKCRGLTNWKGVVVYITQVYVSIQELKGRTRLTGAS